MRLSRLDLLELLLIQSKEIDQLKAQLAEAKEKLENRQITFQRCGSLAEAALAINGVMQAAQQAANDYLFNVQQMADAYLAEVKEGGEDEAAE